MRNIPLTSVLFILFFMHAVAGEDQEADAPKTPNRVHRFINGSVSITLPSNWTAAADKFTTGKFVVVSDARLKEAQSSTEEAAMGVFKVEVLSDAGSPADILAHKLYEEGGLPEGAEIETLEINHRPVARMAAMDEMFGQSYLWYAVVIQLEDGLVVYTSFTGLGDYETNGVIDAVVETIVVDSAAFKATLAARQQTAQA